MIYTSRYARKGLNDAEHYAIRITRGAPRFPIAYQLREVLWDIAPPREALGIEDEDEFRRVYFAHLDRVGVERIIQALDAAERQAGKRKVLLLCFCGVDHAFCHRHLFAEWFHQETGVPIHEL